MQEIIGASDRILEVHLTTKAVREFKVTEQAELNMGPLVFEETMETSV